MLNKAKNLVQEGWAALKGSLKAEWEYFTAKKIKGPHYDISRGAASFSHIGYLGMEDKDTGEWVISARLHRMSRGSGFISENHHEILRVSSEEEAQEWIDENGETIKQKAALYIERMGYDVNKSFPSIANKNVM